MDLERILKNQNLRKNDNLSKHLSKHGHFLRRYNNDKYYKTKQQFVSGPWGGYTQFVNRSKEFTVAAAPFTVILTPNSKWTVRGTIGQDDGIACEIDSKASLCEETYAPGQHLHLKVILNGDEDMIGWQVNDQFMSDADLLKMLIPE